jgi:hypothetical protein
MKIKTDDSGNPIFQDGKPVYVMDDGQEFIADVPSMYKKTIELKGESKRFREKADSSNRSLSAFQQLFGDTSIDELSTWKKQADEALITVQNLDEKQLLDAGKVEEIKQSMKEGHEKNLSQVKTQYETEKKKLVDEMTRKDDQIFKLMIGNAFSNSKYFAGKEPLTILPADAALALFGNNFKIEKDKNGELAPVGYYNGAEILSSNPETVGEVATVEEAIGFLLEKYPNKERIMPSGKPGSGAGGGQGSFSGGDELSKVQASYQEALKSGDGKAAIMLKNKMFALQQRQQHQRM